MNIFVSARRAVCVGLFFLAAGAAQGQILHPTSPLPSFEVATVKLWQPPPPPPMVPGKPPVRFDPGGPPRLTDRARRITPIFELILSAYNLPPSSDRLVGGPDWLRSEAQQYELQTKIDDAEFEAMQKMSPAQQQERLKLMEQSLLADRFQLKVHFETREIQTFVLEVAKGGPKMALAKEGEPYVLFHSTMEGDSGIHGSGVTMDKLVHSPLLLGGRTVVDQTSLTGAYNFVIKIGPDDSIYTALQEQLGLRLVAKKIPMEVIVIDHVERPSLN